MNNIIVSLMSAILGGIVATIIKSILDKKREIELSLNKITEDKYRSLLVFMACALDISKKRYFSLNEQVPNITKEDYLNQIAEYYYHSILYSSDEVIIALKHFIENPNKDNYIITAKAMRNDLWKSKTNLTYEDILLK
jgi:hypothetical protein